ncbi:MAG: DUF5063 domain-containing protein [Bacteroidales bacterium]|nr:DUF5063 domain-containing protein [Bacteroidales bacterium]
MHKSEHIVYSGKVLDMLTVANEYCHFIESSKEKPLEDVVFYLQKILPLLYLKGSLLPDVKVSDTTMNERYVTEEAWEDVFNTLHTIFNDNDAYLCIDDPFETAAEPVLEQLSENFADIYQDMKDFIILYQKPLTASKENAVKECRQLFGTHWGKIIVKASPVLHHLLTALEKGKNEQ